MKGSALLEFPLSTRLRFTLARLSGNITRTSSDQLLRF